jgi:hypothetical protein
MNQWYVEPPISLSLTKMKQCCIDKGLLKRAKMRGKQCSARKKQLFESESNDDNEDDAMDVATQEEEV